MSVPQPYTLDKVVRSLLMLVCIVAGVWLVGYVADVLVPLALGFLLAYILDPLVQQVERVISNHGAAVLVTVFLVLGCLIGIGALVIPTISQELRNLTAMLRELLEPGSTLRQGLAEWLPLELLGLVDEVLKDEDVQTFLRESSELQSAMVVAAKKLLPKLWGLVSGAFSVVGVAIQCLLVLVYLIFILVDFRKFKASWDGYLPPAWREPVVDFLTEFNDAMSVYFRGQFMVASSVGILFAIGFSIVGIKMAVILGLFIGLLNMVPYLQIAGVVPALLLAILTALERGVPASGLLIGVAVVFLVVQIIQDVILTPRIMGKVTGLRPVLILFCVFFWGKLLGFLGVLLAIPLTCLGLAHYRRLLKAQSLELAQGAAQ
ncbi:MAG: AI-2E family transporter [Myxococcota bacterium]|nr:AI-2E family transporter [Myxococcota bacterium]